MSALFTPRGRAIISGGYLPETAALLAAMTTKPNPQRAALIDSTIGAMKAAGLWGKLGLFYMLAAHNAQAAGLNWVSPSTAALVPTNSPTFAIDKGYTGDGSTNYLETGVALNTIPTFAMNTGHGGVWALTASGNPALGISNGFQFDIATGSTRNVRVNSSAALGTTGDATTGHVVGVRRDSANLFSYRNGGTEVTGANVSVVLVNGTVRILTSSTLFYSGQVAAAHLGDQLSAAQVAALYAILQKYLHQVGAV